MLCPICKTPTTNGWPVKKEHGEIFRIMACEQCRARFDARCVTVKANDDEGKQLTVNKQFYAKRMETAEFDSILKTYHNMMSRMIRFAHADDVYVEFGVGLGMLARAASPFFKKVYGLDLEVDTANTCGPIPDNVEFILHGDFLSSFEDEISVLCAWHVVEHLPDPHAVLKPLFSKLAKGGLFCGQVPMYREKYVFEAHYVFHNERSLMRLMDAYGMYPIYFEHDEQNGFLSFTFRK